MNEKIDSDALKLMYKFGSFRPSDRSEILEALKGPDGNRVFVDAVIEYLKRWQRADWIECYSVERIATWVAKNTSDETQQELKNRLQSYLAQHQETEENAYRCFSATLRYTADSGSSALQAL